MKSKLPLYGNPQRKRRKKRRIRSIPILLFVIVLIWLIWWFLWALLWLFRHSQCYSREAFIEWKEAPIHRIENGITRVCPKKAYPLDIKPEQIICLVSLTDHHNTFWQRHLHCRNFDAVGTLSRPNQIQYAEKHGYRYIDGSYALDSTRPPAWSKIRAVQSAFQKNCDWVWWLDADVVVMNATIQLESLLPAAPVDLVVTPDRRLTANSGSWFLRNSDWSRQFLDDWWNSDSFVREPGLSLSGDNAAFGNLIQQHEGSSNILMLPQCTFNSFGAFLSQDVPPSEWFQQEWYQSERYYHHGDFVAHASGIDQKEAGVRLLLEHAE